LPPRVRPPGRAIFWPLPLNRLSCELAQRQAHRSCAPDSTAVTRSQPRAAREGAARDGSRFRRPARTRKRRVRGGDYAHSSNGKRPDGIDDHAQEYSITSLAYGSYDNRRDIREQPGVAAPVSTGKAKKASIRASSRLEARAEGGSRSGARHARSWCSQTHSAAAVRRRYICSRRSRVQAKPGVERE